MNAEDKDEEMVELFKAFGAHDDNGIITVAGLEKALQDGGDGFKESELNMLFEEIAGASKRPTMSAERRYLRAQGINFQDFLLMMLPK